MSCEKESFGKEGLVLDKDRVLTYSKLSCPLECRYCFVDNLSSSNQQKGVVYLSPKQMELMENLPEEIRFVMLGCDTEFFQNRGEALNILHEIIKIKKDISVITKLALSEKYLDELASISEMLKCQGNTFSFSVSLPSLESSKIWEPKVPSPERRIKVLQGAFDRDVNTLVAIRPLLPTITDDEISRLVEHTKNLTKGYYSGPLYLKNLDSALIPDDVLETLFVEQLQPDWMPKGNIFYKVERPGQMEFLRRVVEDAGARLFDGAAEANEYLRTYEKY